MQREKEEGDVPTKPVKAGRKDLGVAGIVVCVCVWMCGWEEVVILDDVDESRMPEVRLCFDDFVGIYMVDEVVVDRRMLVACCSSRLIV